LSKLKVIKIVRSGKFQSRVETSDHHQLVLEHIPVRPFVGMELDIEEVKASDGELRPLVLGDKYPELLKSGLEV